MTRTFIQTDEFVRNWEKLGLTDDELRKLELTLLKNRLIAPVIKGTGGLRKIRFALPNRGKRGSVRVCYVDFVIEETIYLITVYSKKEKDDLTQKECADVKKAIEILKSSLQ